MHGKVANWVRFPHKYGAIEPAGNFNQLPVCLAGFKNVAFCHFANFWSVLLY